MFGAGELEACSVLHQSCDLHLIEHPVANTQIIHHALKAPGTGSGPAFAADADPSGEDFAGVCIAEASCRIQHAPSPEQVIGGADGDGVNNLLEFALGLPPMGNNVLPVEHTPRYLHIEANRVP